MKVVVLDVYSRMGLTIANALAREHEVIGGAIASGASARVDRTFRTRKLDALFRYPSPLRDPTGFGDAVLAACERYRPDAVFPLTTASVLALSRLRAERGAPPGTTFLVEDVAAVERLADKWTLHQVCQELGVPTPRTVLPVGDAAESVHELGLPVIAKPRLSEAARGVHVLHTREEVDELVRNPPTVGTRVGGDAYPYVLQELVAGEINDANGCAAAGTVLMSMTLRRVLTRHEFGGNGLVHETTREPEIAAHLATVMRHFAWNGPLELEFVKAPDGSFSLIDANPRVWGNVQMAIDLGQDVASAALAAFTGGPLPEPVLDYPVGTLLRWYTPGTFACCFRAPRTPSAVRRRLAPLLVPRRGSLSNLRAGDLRHLIGMTLDSSAKRARDAAAPPG